MSETNPLWATRHWCNQALEYLHSEVVAKAFNEDDRDRLHAIRVFEDFDGSKRIRKLFTHNRDNFMNEDVRRLVRCWLDQFSTSYDGQYKLRTNHLAEAFAFASDLRHAIDNGSESIQKALGIDDRSIQRDLDAIATSTRLALRLSSRKSVQEKASPTLIRRALSEADGYQSLATLHMGWLPVEAHLRVGFIHDLQHHADEIYRLQLCYSADLSRVMANSPQMNDMACRFVNLQSSVQQYSDNLSNQDFWKGVK